MCAMKILLFIKYIIEIISGSIGYLLKYKIIYKLTGVFFTRKFGKAKQNHKYAILVAARNEETVIGNLVDSINQQDYPRELITIFVVADNCTDNTAKIAREAGAICYERFDNEHRTKGYALQFLVENIRRDYGIESFEGYFLFDADNLLKEDYITRMNEAFDSGQKIITSYRNTKNFGDNWISASYGVHWLRTVRNEHRARSLFRLATRIQGTGFLFTHEIIKDGWNYVSLTEDRAFCADAVAKGYQISYNNEAVFYDEQPVNIKIALRQRVRWAKGHLQALVETGPKLLKHIFVTGGVANRDNKDAPRWKKFLYNIRLRFMSLDMLSVVYPRQLMLLLKKIVIYYLVLSLILIGWECYDFNFFRISVLGTPVIDGLKFVSAQHGSGAVIGIMTLSLFYTGIVSYFINIFSAVYIYFIERKRIEHIPFFKKAWFCITFPLFDIIGRFSLLVAIFKKVEWKTIPHTSNVTIEDIRKGTSHK